jgi:gliding motility-associated-like protein
MSNDPIDMFGFSETGPFGPASNFQSIDVNTPGDPILDAISGVETFNAAILEFDFIPQSDTVKFRYVFGSEEYNDFVNSTVNDAFAFILSGVSTPLAPTNIALIPGTTTPVSINTVNNGEEDWLTGLSAGPCENCAYFRDNVGEIVNVTYDGLTTVLTAIHPVICGETYHIKIMIADGGDGVYDSGVFLEAGSFSSQAPLQISSSVNGVVGDTVAVEGCDQFSLDFVRPAAQINTAASYDIVIGGNAINGVDYSAFPSTINFGVGEDTVTYVLDPSNDALFEGTENFSITINNITVCGVLTSVTYNYYIEDVQPLTVVANDVSICPGATATIDAIVNGGAGTINYQWNGGALGTTNSISVSPAVTTTYTVSVDDNCVGTPPATEIVTVNVVPAFSLSIPIQDTVFCSNEVLATINSITTPVTQGAWTGSLLITDNGNGSVSFNPSQLPLGNTTLTFTAGSSGCSSNETVVVVVNEFVSSNFNAIPSVCENASMIPIVSNSTLGDWYLDGLTFSSAFIDPSIISAGTHELKHVTGIPDCPDSTISIFTINPLPVVSFSADTLKGCLVGANVFNFTSSVTPVSQTGSTYIWTFGDGSTITGFANPVHIYGNSGVFTVQLNYVDNNGCAASHTETSYITVHPQPAANFIFSDENPTMIDPTVSTINLTAGVNNIYTWDLNGELFDISTNTTFQFDAPGIYTVQLQVTDENSCKDSITRNIQVVNDFVVYIPSAFSPNGDGINDFFYPKTSGVLLNEDYKMQIFNRWGEKIFETEDYTDYWKGTKNNADSRAIEDAYIYKIYYKAFDNKIRLEQGTIMLIK